MKKTLLLLTVILMIATSFYKRKLEVNSKNPVSTKIEKNSGKTTELSELKLYTML